MYQIEQEGPPEEFAAAWRCAGRHIQIIGQGGVQWLRATLNPPIAEHLSFRLGNQLFFVYVDVEVLPFIGKRKELFLRVASEATATPCLLKMQRSGETYKPASSLSIFDNARYVQRRLLLTTEAARLAVNSV